MPELLPWSGDDREPEVVIRLGDVPEYLDEARVTGRRLQVSEDLTCRYEHPVAGPLLIRGGRQVVMAPARDVEAARLAAVLLGPVLGILCHQRGLVPLHACCVEVGGEAVAITGPSGAGKSTLAAAFMHAGHRVLSDDLTVVDPRGGRGPRDTSGPSRPLVLPAVPRLKLTAETLDRLGSDPRDLDPSPTRPDKLHLPIPGAFQPSPLPLRAVCHLDAGRGEGAEGLERLRGADAVAETLSAVYARRLGARLLGRGVLFERVARVLVTVERVYRLGTATGWRGLEEAVARLAPEDGPPRSRKVGAARALPRVPESR